MKQVITRNVTRLWWPILCVALTAGVTELDADQVQMQNGDCLNGKVVSLNSETLVFQNEHLGIINLPRVKVSSIILGTPPKPGVTGLTGKPGALTNAQDPNGIAAKLNSNTNLIQRIQKQFLTGAGPEAQDKFDELVSGLLSGKLTVEDVKSQARATAEQVRAARKDMDESSRWAIDGYLAILDQFLGSNDASPKTGTNSPSSKVKPFDPEDE